MGEKRLQFNPENKASKENNFFRIGRRAVIVCNNNVSYAGIIRGIYEINNKKGELLELDTFSGLCVWVPLDFVKEIMVIPISE
jgi:hypothetical protein